MTTRKYHLAAERNPARRLRRHDGFHELLGNGTDTKINGRPTLRTVLLPGDIMQLEEGIQFQIRMNNARVAVLMGDGDLTGNQHMKVRRLGKQLRSRGFLVLHLTPGVTQDETHRTLTIPPRVYKVPGVLKWSMYDIKAPRDIAEWLAPFRSPINTDMDHLFVYLSQPRQDRTLEFLHKVMAEINMVSAKRIVVLDEDLTCNRDDLTVREGVLYITSEGITGGTKTLKMINWAIEVTSDMNPRNWIDYRLQVSGQDMVIPGVKFGAARNAMDIILMA